MAGHESSHVEWARALWVRVRADAVAAVPRVTWMHKRVEIFFKYLSWLLLVCAVRYAADQSHSRVLDLAAILAFAIWMLPATGLVRDIIVHDARSPGWRPQLRMLLGVAVFVGLGYLANVEVERLVRAIISSQHQALKGGR